MKDKAMTKRTLQEYLRDAQDAVARSNALWRSVNTAIACVLENAIRRRRSRRWVSDRLMKMAGPKQKGEPIAVESYRSVARQIANGDKKLTLL